MEHGFPYCNQAGCHPDCGKVEKRDPSQLADGRPSTGPGTSLGSTRAAKDASTLYPGWIETYSGIQWNCIAPRVEDVRLDDIAHGLALMCRFGGQVKVPYSVGQHSLYVYGIIRNKYPYEYVMQLHALLHDASEAYLSDIVRPLKVQVPQYLEIEARTQDAILTALEIPPLTPNGAADVKAADNAALAAEYRDLYPTSKLGWTLPEPAHHVKVVPINDWVYIESKIINEYYYLKGLYHEQRRILQGAFDSACRTPR